VTLAVFLLPRWWSATRCGPWRAGAVGGVAAVAVVAMKMRRRRCWVKGLLRLGIIEARRRYGLSP
jgi:hypothetical protein